MHALRPSGTQTLSVASHQAKQKTAWMVAPGCQCDQLRLEVEIILPTCLSHDFLLRNTLICRPEMLQTTIDHLRVP